MISRELSQRYQCALLNLDQVIIDAIDSAQRNEYAQRAYHMCRDAYEKHIDEQRQAEVDADHVATTAQLGIIKYKIVVFKNIFLSIVKSKARRPSSLLSKETSFDSKITLPISK